jgi:signal transduction histidine kinase
MDGWLFKQGADSTTGEWKLLKPTGLHAAMADNNGRLEGWFKVNLLFDSSFTQERPALRYYAWAAADIFVNGQRWNSYGKIGHDRQDFIEYNPSNKLPATFAAEPGKMYSLLIHFADYVSPLNKKKLKSEDTELKYFARIIGPQYLSRFQNHIRQWPVYTTIWITDLIGLSFLFWLLAFLNKREPNLRLIALAVTFFGLEFFCRASSDRETITYLEFRLFMMGFQVFSLLSMITTIIILAKVFTNRISRFTRIVIGIYLVIGLNGLFRQTYWMAVFLNLAPLIVYTYYIISSWKKVKGAQWAIVTGLMLNLLFSVLFIAMLITYESEFFPNVTLLATFIALLLPVCLLVYVALRFKEIITEVEMNSARIIQSSEEKREQALKQQEILEEEVKKQTAELRTTLENLKATQSQLIHAEKMASLGELTAGIAHEIQNPLNFVNNFSEINKELIVEMRSELDAGKIESAKEISAGIEENEDKIMQHGKRADAIVKSMLQHSRSNNGKKEPADLNRLVEEFLKLAYHGYRARDKSFSSKFNTDFDPGIGEINIVAQDIGRVLLNLVNNAFYAVTERKKREPAFDPLVMVSTKKSNGKILISIKDNGKGIPASNIDKVFQPFFTTKPTGQGTGLGLSLSYDIIKAHGGDMKIESVEGNFTEVVITLPEG